MSAPVYAWAVRDPNGINVATVSWGREAARAKWLSFWDPQYPSGKWRHWYRRGHRCVRVRIEEVNDEQ